MRKLTAFSRLIRWPNLVFIALTQLLVQLCLIRPLFPPADPVADSMILLCWIGASVSIAAAGYVINDYFDVNIDEVNRPETLVVDRVISRRWAMLWHLLLNALGLGLTAIAVDWSTHGYLWFANLSCVALLWLYSTRFKKTLLLGNILIAVLTSWTLLVIFLSNFKLIDLIGSANVTQQKLARIVLLYAGFAFITTLIREAVKDMEDRIGDARAGCRTLPIVWGFPAAKMYTAVWTIVLIVVLLIVYTYVLPFGWWGASLFGLSALIAPLVIFLARLMPAQLPTDFHQLSRTLKWVMLAGILSMSFFYT